MTFILFLWCILGDPEPMTVLPGDAIIDVTITTLSGENHALEDVVDTSLVWFLSTDCGKCLEAYEHINTLFAERYHTVILFLDGRESVKEFILENKPETPVYLVNPADLATYRIKTVPALILYRNSKLAYAFHGPLFEERAHKMLAWFGDRFGDM